MGAVPDGCWFACLPSCKLDVRYEGVLHVGQATSSLMHIAWCRDRGAAGGRRVAFKGRGSGRRKRMAKTRSESGPRGSRGRISWENYEYYAIVWTTRRLARYFRWGSRCDRATDQSNMDRFVRDAFRKQRRMKVVKRSWPDSQCRGGY